MKTLPHEAQVTEFVDDIGALYDLGATDRSDLRDEIDRAVSAAAVRALVSRPRAVEPVERKPQGVKDGPEFMRCDEVSDALGIAQSTLSQMRKRGTGPAFKNEGRSILYFRAAVRAYSQGVPVLGAEKLTGTTVEQLRAAHSILAEKEDPSELRQ